MTLQSRSNFFYFFVTPFLIVEVCKMQSFVCWASPPQKKKSDFTFDPPKMTDLARRSLNIKYKKYKKYKMLTPSAILCNPHKKNLKMIHTPPIPVAYV